MTTMTTMTTMATMTTMTATKAIQPMTLHQSCTNEDYIFNTELITNQLSKASTKSNILQESMIDIDDDPDKVGYSTKEQNTKSIDDALLTDTDDEVAISKARTQKYSICNVDQTSDDLDNLSDKITGISIDASNTKSSSQITTKEDILLNSLMLFYKESEKFDQVLPIIHGQSNISLRILDWFITNYSKKFNVVYKITKSYKTQQFNVYIDYKSQLKAYSKRFFDPFCRRHRIPFVCNNIKIITTIGQLNFFRWAINNNILQYVSENLESIEQNMNEVNKNKVRQYQKKHTKKFNLPVNGPSEDISVSTTKIVNKRNISILVTFE